MNQEKMETKKISCNDCNGDGCTSAHVECEGGGFTQGEWGEMDDDFRQDYMAGKYDVPCKTCKGAGTIIAEVHTHCSSCNKELPPEICGAEYPYCSDKCYWAEYHCRCGQNGCPWCM